jgi:16S rRNA (guanine527-N7)-methyltransferase
VGVPAPLEDVVGQAQAAGFIGAPSITEQLDHSAGLADALPIGARRIADLGAGGGLPGLVVAELRPEAEVRLIESSRRRADHLERAVRRLGWGTRVSIDDRPAELVGRDRSCRGSFDAVVARGFGPPPVVAECAAPLLRVGGVLVVAEPPDSTGDRWAPVRSSALPFDVGILIVDPRGTYLSLTLRRVCPDRFPRAPGVPRRRPVWAPT